MSSTAVAKRRWPWVIVVIAVILAVPIGIVVAPIITHVNQGSAGQGDVTGFPLEVNATGDDGRTRELQVFPVRPGMQVDLAALEVGQRLIVSGTGYDASQGIYVAICVIPSDPSVKPGPCIGGVPDQQQTDVEAGTVQYAPSNWINDDWAWKLFGARSYDDVETGTFTAYLEVGDPVGEGFDCRVDACGIFTRDDHTALNDRVQDLYLPVSFAG